MTRREPSDALRSARLLLDDVSGVTLTEDLAWDSTARCWSIGFRIEIAASSEFVPRRTEWFVLLDENYPRGRVEIYPSNSGGLTKTFPHQLLNLPNPSQRWSLGRICVDVPGFGLARWTETGEPRTLARLRWHVARAREWVTAAAAGTLRRDGDRFELPNVAELGAPRIAFEEGSEHMASWQATPHRHGAVEFRQGDGGTLIVTRWMASSGVVRASAWNARIQRAQQAARGFWMLLDAMPVVPPFKWPCNWGELIEAGGKGFLSVLRDIVARARPRNTAVLLIGFPIPERVGEANIEVHWTAARLGPFQTSRRRRCEEKLWARDRELVLNDEAPILWLPTENWHPDRLGARGRLNAKLRSRRVGLIGAGALGSHVAELLLRGGVNHVALIDGDVLLAVNLVRHTLTLDDHRKSKAQALADRLNAVSPFASVHAITSMLSLDEVEAQKVLGAFDMIVDCTANDDVIRLLGRMDFGVPKLFASAAVGRESRRLYFFEAEGPRFPASTFWRDADPWFIDERVDGWEETRFEGAGCWHPIFPAQATDLTMMAAVTVKRLERLAERGSGVDGELQVFEQAESGDGFTRLQRARESRGASGGV